MKFPSSVLLSLILLVLSFVIIWQSISSERAENMDPHSSDSAVSNLKMYPGLEATLFASEPLIASPTNLDIDARGRVWVTEVVNYRDHAENNKRPEGDRILILEDTDGDGKSDESKVYYQGRDIDAALGISVLGNKVIVTCAPNVLIFTDEDGDDKPDRKEYLFTKSGSPQGDHSTHSVLFGPDGKLYWNMGNSGLYVHDKHGNPVIDKAGNTVFARGAEQRATEFRGKTSPYQGGMVFRFNLDGSQFEVLGHNFRNNYEVTVDSFGNLWQSDNDDDGNFGCRLNYIMEFGNFGYRDELTGAGWQASRTGQHPEIPRRHWHQNDPGVVPNFVQTGAGSPTGITFYEGRLLPQVFWNQVINCDAGPGVVWAAIANKQGAGYQGKMVNILEEDNDKWVRPVDVSVAPDGSLFVTDWYDPVVGWNRQHDTGRGRIFRIAPSNHPYQVSDFDLDTPEGAVAALKSPNYALRFLAWQTLNKMQEKAEPALIELFQSNNPRYRARALWLLTKISGHGFSYVEQAIHDSDEDIRVVGLRAARQLEIDVIPLIRELVQDASPQVLRESAIALRHSTSSSAPELWAELATRHDGHDRWYLEALGIGADGRWDEYLGAWLKKMGTQWQNVAGRDIIWRSRARVTPRYLARILRSPDVDLEGSKAYLRAFDFQGKSQLKTQSLRSLVFEPLYEDTGKSAFVGAEAMLRLEDFDLAAEPSLRPTVDRILKLVEGTEQFARLVQLHELREYYPGLMQVAIEHGDNPTGLVAIRTLLQNSETVLIENYLSSNDVNVAVQTAQVLGNSRDPKAFSFLKGTLQDETLSWSVREQAVRSLAGTRGGIEVLVETAKSGEFPEALREVAGASISRTMSVRQRNEAAQFFPLPEMKNNQPVPQMTELLVHVGDPQRGKDVFESAECNKCHLIHGTGTNFGPDLSEIGNKLSKTGIYESVLDPSGGVSPTYKLYHFTLSDGQEISGFVVSETVESVTLRMEGGIISDYDKSILTSRRESSLSAMPSDLQAQLSRDELVDLVEYLASLK